MKQVTVSREASQIFAAVISSDIHAYVLAHQDEYNAFKKAETLKNMQTTPSKKKRQSRKIKV